MEEYKGDIPESLQTAVGENGADEEAEEAKEDTAKPENTSYQDWQGRMRSSVGKVNMRNSSEQTLTSIRQITVQYIFQLLFGARRNRMRDWISEDDCGGQSSHTSSGGAGTQNQNPASTANLRVMTYQQETFHLEQENTSFSTQGTVKTADGREITFNVNVEMSREFQSSFSEDLYMAAFRLCDPLVINLDCDAAQIEDQTFYFDIDADGEPDEVSRLGGGSGFLALDSNEDGVINDGSELFGTKSGNGFKDLAKYDEDGNGWIDENDPIWSRLKIWCKDEDGNDVLYRLADKGVGAICLQNVSTDFTMQGTGGQTRGVVRSTGIFLYENGLAGTIQHVDMAKYDMGA